MKQEVIVPTKTSDPAPLAVVYGKELTSIPEGLYIPPDALRIFLETFEGPLDLLLYLIKKQNIDILDIPIFSITKQYVQYVELMQGICLDLAAEYLVMAATLAEIKSRMLLPKPQQVEEEESNDPRAELVRRLQEYERFKKAAEQIDELERVGRDTFILNAMLPEEVFAMTQPEVEVEDLLSALCDLMKRVEFTVEHRIEREVLSIRERMTMILSQINEKTFVEFTQFFTSKEGRLGVVVTLIAILELVRQKLVECVQSAPYKKIYIKIKARS